MDTFETGFLSFATEFGLSQKEASQLWKRANEYPGSAEVFKKLDIPAPTAQDNLGNEELSSLSKLMEQEKIQQELQSIKQNLGI
jgi:hypothetical protein